MLPQSGALCLFAPALASANFPREMILHGEVHRWVTCNAAASPSKTSRGVYVSARRSDLMSNVWDAALIRYVYCSSFYFTSATRFNKKRWITELTLRKKPIFKNPWNPQKVFMAVFCLLSHLRFFQKAWTIACIISWASPCAYLHEMHRNCPVLTFSTFLLWPLILSPLPTILTISW